MLFDIRSGVRQSCAPSPTLFNYIIDQALQDYPDYKIEMQGLLEAVNRHAAAVGMRINASRTKVMSALIPGEQR